MQSKCSPLQRPITKPGQVLVEGRTCELFVKALVRTMSLADRLEVRDFGPKEGLKTFLAAFTGLREFRLLKPALGIVRDAEDGPAPNAFDSVRDALRGVGLVPPVRMGTVGPDVPRVGVYILPDCSSPGMLESLCYDSIGHEAVKVCVEAYFACVHKTGGPLPKNMAKAKVFAYLATKDISDPLVGRAAQAGIWDWNAQPFARLKTFLRDVAGSEHDPQGLAAHSTEPIRD